MPVKTGTAAAHLQEYLTVRYSPESSFDPRMLIADAVSWFAVNEMGITDEALIQQLASQVTAVSDWETGGWTNMTGDQGSSWGLFHSNLGGRGATYTSEELLDPVLSTVLSVDELLRLWADAGAPADPMAMAENLVRAGQRPDPKNVEAVNSMVAYVAAGSTRTAPADWTRAGVGETTTDGGGGLPGGEGVTDERIAAYAQQWGLTFEEAQRILGGGAGELSDEQIIQMALTGLNESEGEWARLLFEKGWLPVETEAEAYEAWGRLLDLAAEAGVSEQEILQALNPGPLPGVPEALEQLPFVGPFLQQFRESLEATGAPSADRYARLIPALETKAREGLAARLGVTPAWLDTAERLGLSDEDMEIAAGQGWEAGYAAQLRDLAGQKGMTLEQAVRNGYIAELTKTPTAADPTAGRLYLETIGGGDAARGAEELDRLRRGMSVEEYAAYQDIITGAFQRRGTEIVETGRGGEPGGTMDLSRLTPEQREHYAGMMQTLYSVAGPGVYSAISEGIGPQARSLGGGGAGALSSSGALGVPGASAGISVGRPGGTRWDRASEEAAQARAGASAERARGRERAFLEMGPQDRATILAGRTPSSAIPEPSGTSSMRQELAGLRGRAPAPPSKPKKKRAMPVTG